MLGGKWHGDAEFKRIEIRDGIRLNLGFENTLVYHSISSRPGDLSGVGKSIDAAIRVPKPGELGYAKWEIVMLVKRRDGYPDDADALAKAASNIAVWATSGSHVSFVYEEEVGEDEYSVLEERYSLVAVSCASEVFVPGRSVKITLTMQGYYEGTSGSVGRRITIGNGRSGQGGTVADDGIGRVTYTCSHSSREPAEVEITVVTRSDDDHLPVDESGRRYISIMGLCHDPITGEPLEVRLDASPTTTAVHKISALTGESSGPSGAWAPEFYDTPSVLPGVNEIAWRGVADGEILITYKDEER